MIYKSICLFSETSSMLDELPPIKNVIIIWSHCLWWDIQRRFAFSMAPVPIMSLLFKCATDRKMETLSIATKDQDDLIRSHIMKAYICIFASIILLCVHMIKQSHVSWIQHSGWQQEFIYTHLALCAALSHFTHGCAHICHVQREGKKHMVHAFLHSFLLS